jgi:hypothetical protein
MALILSLLLHKLKNSSCEYSMQKQKGYAISVSKAFGRRSIVSKQWLACDPEVTWQTRCKNAFYPSFRWNFECWKVWPKTKEPIMKLKYIMDYSCKIGAVGWTDMLLSYVQCICKSVKWYKKLALHILNIALLRAHAPGWWQKMYTHDTSSLHSLDQQC